MKYEKEELENLMKDIKKLFREFTEIHTKAMITNDKHAIYRTTLLSIVLELSFKEYSEKSIKLSNCQ